MLSINRSKRSRGRPRKDSEAILVRLPQNLLEGVDQHIKKSTESIGRPEAIRQLLAIAGSRTPPPNWGADALSKFMDWAYASRWATFYRVHSEFERLIGIDSCFLDLFKASKWTDPKRLIEVGLLARCHSAYRAACENATAGQLAEVYAQLRACLEYASYSLHMKRNPGHDLIWSDRKNNQKSVKTAFLAIDVKKSVVTENKKIGADYGLLYERCIAYGAHPNEAALFNSLQVLKTVEGGAEIIIKQLQGHGNAMKLALKTTAQVGVCALDIYALIFPERFRTVGVGDKISKFKKGI